MKLPRLDAPIIIRTTPTDHDFYDYHHEARFAEIRNKMREREYTVSKTGISYRVMSHWEKSGILPEGIKSTTGEWRKFSLVEVIWLEAVKRMREFGLSLEKIETACEHVMRWHKKTDCYPDLEYFVVKADASSINPYILVLSSGYADVASIEDIELSKYSLGHSDLLLISIKSILEGRGAKVRKAKPLIGLSSEEIELLWHVRGGESDEVKAKIRNGKIAEIETTDNYPEAPPMSQIGKKFKENRTYGEVNTKYENGRWQSAQVKRRKRFK